MKSKKTNILQLPVNLLLLAIISALFVIFVFLLKQRASVDEPMVPTPTIQPITTAKELDTILEDLNKLDTTTQISTELNKLSADSSGI